MPGVVVEVVCVSPGPTGREWHDVPEYELAYSLDHGGVPQEGKQKGNHSVYSYIETYGMVVFRSLYSLFASVIISV